ncbi:spindle and centriole-associated protein 1 isoform X4 [Apteryx rowi]|uniref:spindle and centriole-associated protein 1 isoform X4 n=1 Tax=Apteryx rowi TaxID=308060 RepID=UPI000E1D0D9C|nr:spindle and centriole-associated protein 1 isoform X4 [Apteryx rowi]
MSLLRGPRPRGPWAAARKGPRKPAAAKRDWDSTVHDLTVHCATPEDILRRRELHMSKNKALVHLELQEKALKRKWKKQKEVAPGSLEKRKLMREILSDQYQLQDVLERSDQVMAVVKDLFGDAPCRRTGFPNVTMAPNCDLEFSEGPIVQKRDPSTPLSILSESVMDSQALNEVAEETSSICQSEDEQRDSLNFKSSINSDRLLRLLREENSSGNSQLWAEKEMRKTMLSQEANVPLTPATASPSLKHSALNATSEVKRICSRLLNEEVEETVDSTYTVRQVLNPDSRKQKQISAKMKRKQAAQNSSRQRAGDSHANSIPTDLPRDNKSSLDVLNRMIHEVEHELEEYERGTGREVQKTRKNEGLTGFTLSLVNALCRLMRYLRESEMQLREKELMRQQHEQMLNEHRELIDALTAEILLVREENVTIQKKLQQYMIATDEQLTSLVQAFKGLPLAESKKGQSPNHFGIVSKGPAISQEQSALSYFEPSTDASNGENMLKFPHEEMPVKFPQRPSASDSVGAGRSLPTHIFQPAVLLSPPRQKSSQESSSLQNGNRFLLQTKTWRVPKRKSACLLQTHLAVAKSLEERIAELNRQSAEARDKLLQLIDQQKLAAAHMLSPMISPIPPPSLNYTENARKTTEVSIPVAFAMDNSKEDTPSPAGVTSMRRSAGSSSKPCSPLSATSESVKLSPVRQRPKLPVLSLGTSGSLSLMAPENFKQTL